VATFYLINININKTYKKTQLLLRVKKRLGMKITVFCDVNPRSPLDLYWCFGWKWMSACKWRQHVPPRRQWSTRRHWSSFSLPWAPHQTISKDSVFSVVTELSTWRWRSIPSQSGGQGHVSSLYLASCYSKDHSDNTPAITTVGFYCCSY
jgi:hypothetical protein